MKKSETEPEKETQNLYDIKDLKIRNKTPGYLFDGVCAKNNWHSGKVVSEKEYKDAVTTFQKSPMGGK